MLMVLPASAYMLIASKGSGYVPQVEAVDMMTTRIRDCLSC